MCALHARRGHSARHGELDVESWGIGIGCGDVRATELVEAILRVMASWLLCFGALGYAADMCALHARRDHSARRSERRVVPGYIGVGCGNVLATELVEAIMRVMASWVLCLGTLRYVAAM